MSRTSGRAAGDSPVNSVLGLAREIKRALDATTKPLRDNPGGQHGADFWMGVWRTAQALRLKTDQLAAHAAQQARLARQQAHPDSQPTPEETPDD